MDYGERTHESIREPGGRVRVKSGLRAASYRNDVMNVTSSILVDARHSLRELFKSLQNHPLPSLPYVRKGDYGAFPLTYERKTADVLRRFIIPACFSLLFLFSRRYAPVPLALFCGILFQAHLRPSQAIGEKRCVVRTKESVTILQKRVAM